ncbi:MAG TPA: aminoglycoside phosphotransferase family protein [Bryobacteraceae bacterium]|nr:aminoglycoside phosphotransferase family protein [Bryobacteraceae bacterium]
MSLRIPAALEINCRKTPQRSAWLAQLPDALRQALRQWSLTLGPPFDHKFVSCAWVAPVTLPNGTLAILKLGMPHMEAEHEVDGLRFWNGDGMVRLLAADDGLGAMLIEHCEPGTPLSTLPESEQDPVVAGLLRRLWRTPPVPHLFRPLSALLEFWSDETQADRARWPDAGLVRAGLELFQELPRTASKNVVLATDLHAGNVLRAAREPWLAIDPKPFAGDPAYDATQHLFNGMARLCSDPSGAIRRFADLLEVDAERVRLWTFARAAAEPRDDWQGHRFKDLVRRIAP